MPVFFVIVLATFGMMIAGISLEGLGACHHYCPGGY
jgi:hypothetical protein